MHMTIPLGFGKLKIKTYRFLRQRERDGQVPSLRVGDIYVIYRRRSKHRH